MNEDTAVFNYACIESYILCALHLLSLFALYPQQRAAANSSSATTITAIGTITAATITSESVSVERKHCYNYSLSYAYNKVAYPGN